MAAYRLARAGWRILLVEKGTAPPPPRKNRPEALGLETTRYRVNGRSRRLKLGTGPGGGTSVYGAALLRPLPEDFSPGRYYADFLPKREWDWPVSFNAMDFEALLKERILDPLDLQDTYIEQSPSQAPRRATGYAGVVARPDFKMEVLGPAGALVSTASDLLTFAEHQIGLKSSSLDEAFATAHRKRKGTGSPGTDIGLGWFLVSNVPHPFIMHDGATMGHNSFLACDPIRKTAVVVLCNGRANTFTSTANIGLHILIPQSPLATIRRPATVSMEDLQAIYGQYAAVDSLTFTFGIEHEHLTVEVSNTPGTRYTMYPLTSRRFKLYEAIFDASANFGLDANNQPSDMTWVQFGNSSNYLRQALPAQIHLARQGDHTTIQLADGDGITSYEIQQSTDFQHWEPVATMTLWEDPLSIDPSGAQGFFRAVLPGE